MEYAERYENEEWWDESEQGPSSEIIRKSLRGRLASLGQTVIRREISIYDYRDRRTEPRFIDLQEAIGAQVLSGSVEQGYDEGPPGGSGAEPAIPLHPDDSGPEVVQMPLPRSTQERALLAAA